MVRQPSILPPYFWELRLHLSLACLLAQLRAHALRPPASGEGKGSKAVGSRLCSNFAR